MELSSAARKRAWFFIICALLVLTAAWTGLLPRGLVTCPLRSLTGVPCGSCGMTRAFLALCQGKLMDAVHLHLASPVFFLAGFGVVVIACLELRLDRNLLGPLWNRWGTLATWFGLFLILGGWSVNLAAHFGHPVL